MNLIIATRLYSDKIGRFDADAAANDRTLVDHRGLLSELVMGPSLRNQTDSGFRHYTITNDHARIEISEIYKRRLEAAGVVTTLVPKSEWPDVILMESKESPDGLCVARIDDDDAVHADAVKLAKSHFRKGRLTVYGYTTGIRARTGEDFYRVEKVPYGSHGHHSIFQTYMFDSACGNVFNPYDCDHSDVVDGLVANGMARDGARQSIVNGDADVVWPAFLYLRHGDSVSTRNKAAFDNDSRFPKTSADPELLHARLGVSIATQEKILKGTLFRQ